MDSMNKVFNILPDTESAVFPPSQVFLNANFDFLVTIGGYLADDEMEYEKLRKTLVEVGESEFYIVANLNITTTEIIESSKLVIPLHSNFRIFEEKMENFDPAIGSRSNDFFVFGKNPDWGIYICECPTINIIGCDKSLSEKFKEVYSIKGNGYNELKEFVAKEYEKTPNHLLELENNYNLNNVRSPNR
jgi:hypothetical protein